MIKAVIFDMDGVLVNSEKLKSLAWKNILEKLGIKDGDIWEKQFIGMPRIYLCRKAVSEFSLSLKPEELAEMKKTTYKEMAKNHVEPVQPAIDFLKSLPREKVKIGLATSTDREIVLGQLDMIGLSNHFDAIMCGEDDVKRNKPYPDIYLLAAEKLNIRPEQCVAIEDSGPGVESAKSAGMKCIAYRNPDSGKQDLSKADLIIDDFSKFTATELLSL